MFTVSKNYAQRMLELARYLRLGIRAYMGTALLLARFGRETAFTEKNWKTQWDISQASKSPLRNFRRKSYY